jgi:tetratricopeptide (TPR) repeat protein/ankyrin repeat protein
MRPSRHSRLFFAVLSSALLLPGAALPQQAQSPAQQSRPAATRSPQPDARKAKKFFAQGLRAEQAEDWPAAFEAFDAALNFAPGNADALVHRELARSQMVQQHTDRAEREALAGQMDEARAQLREALRLDPSYAVARERLAQFEQEAQHAPPEPPALTGLIQLEPQAGTRDFDLRGDTHSVYEAVAKQFGLAASFDSDLPVHPVRLRVAAVDFKTAMTIVSQQTGTFWRAIDSHTFFVAQNTLQKRREYAPVVERTLILPAGATPDKMTEAVRLVREIAEVAHTELDTRTHTLTIRASPEDVALAAALLEELEQAPGELMLEIEILEVNRDVARRLGLTPPSTARLITISPSDVRALQQAQNASALLAIVQRVFGATIPPLVAFGGGRTLFLATLPGAAADFSETLSLVRSGRRMLLRAQDVQPATFFIGERFPVALALLGASLAQPQLQPGATPIVFPRTDFPTGNAPVAVAAGDFNGDGRLDLAVVNQGSVATIASSNGAVRATNVVTITTTSPHGLGAGQAVTISGVSDSSFNGTFTIATVPSTTAFTYAQTGPAATSGGGTVSTGTVSILLGNGDGTFQPRVDFATGAQPAAIAVGDFNGDGKLDLAVANQGDNTVSILLGKGDGTFQTHVDFATGAKPVAIVARDFNGDGKLDLAVANQDGNSVSILLGKPDGTFQTHVDFATGTKPAAIAVGDFNGDSKLDLAVANQTDNTVSILLGNGDGTFSAKTDFATGNAPAGLAVADFNLDSRLDLVIANQGSSTVSILLGNGDGSFGTRLEVPTGSGPSSVIAVDLNGDTRPDLAITDQSANTVSVILNPASSISPATSVVVPQTAYPGAEYLDLGLKVKATPRLHADNEVTLQLEFEIRSLSGISINGIPVISNRTVSQTVRLRENETSVLSGIVQKEETRTITGLPRFARAAGVGHLAGRHELQQHETELLILLTPRQLRLAPRTDRSIYAGRGEITPASVRPQVRP